ncbi:MAG TPA: T9SS type A sorting domain-containing protein, partial [Ignavibacteria bacterium]|nr:T9SS type A sorting domain-containing protein [Ignavibacteria bacterium]
VYSPGANTWTPQPTLLAPKTDHGAASVHIGNIWKFVSATGTSNRSANSNTVNILTDTMTGITGIVQTGNNIPDGFSIKQNYPNPFNPVTTINFSIASGNLNKVYTSLIVYDIMGRKVDDIFAGELGSGDYSLQWNAENKPSGTYFAKLVSGMYSNTIKMLLIK